MSESKIITPLLKDLIIGDAISNSHGVRCCPAVHSETDEKFIVKIISVPASQVQMDALLLSGAYPDAQSALTYFKQLAEHALQEAQLLQRLSMLDGFMSFDAFDLVEKEDQSGYELFLLSPYRTTLERHLAQNPMTHMDAVNLGLDLCAALSVCRQSGYLYVALKPDNIYQSQQGNFQIGDLGFINLDALGYTSLPEKYRTCYTAPEIQDAYSSLNQTLDTYAVGMILYQIYNNGQLPETMQELAAPAYADYELAQIILKACHCDPAERWQTPEEMGLAIAGYIRENSIANTPIVPLPEPAEEEPVAAQPDGEQAEDAESEEVAPVDETVPSEETVQDLADAQITPEVSDILEQADDLIDHETPDPVVVPEPAPIDMVSILFEQDDEQKDDTDEAAQEPDTQETQESEFTPEEPVHEEQTVEAKPRKKGALRKLIGILIAVLILLGLVGGGYFYYTNYYIQSVNGITITGDEDWLTVKLDTAIDNELLTVVCKDTFGNTYTQSVADNTARFEKLNPDTHYTVEVQISGFHKLVGEITESYNSPKRINISGITAANGTGDGSVILNIAVTGTNNYKWEVTYAAEDGISLSKVFFGDNVTINGLTVGSEYTFSFSTATGEYVAGVTSIKFTPEKIIVAENIQAVSFIDGKLTVKWEPREGMYPSNWFVNCYNDSGYSHTVITSENIASFENLDPEKDYIIKITAANMSLGTSIRVNAGAINVLEFTAKENNGQLELNWNLDETAPEDGWSIQYTIDNGSVHTLECQNNSAIISPIVPGGHYVITLIHSGETSVLGNTVEYDAAETGALNLLQITKDDLEFKMCRRPNKNGWNHNDVPESDYTLTFSADEKASFVLHLSKAPAAYNDRIGFLFVVRDQYGGVVSVDQYTRNWNVMWYDYYAELNLPVMPTTPGVYTVDIYFNNCLATTQIFKVQ